MEEIGVKSLLRIKERLRMKNRQKCFLLIRIAKYRYMLLKNMKRWFFVSFYLKINLASFILLSFLNEISQKQISRNDCKRKLNG